MPQQRVPALPARLARRPLRTLRPQDAAEVYAHPRPELARLAAGGALHRVANGYYVVIPQEQFGQSWLPSLEPVAAGIGSTIYGPEATVLMGVSAARVWGAIPRALAIAVVAIPHQHRPIRLTDRPAVVQFVKRDTARIDVERVETALGPALVTTVEQTILDLAHRPTLGHAEIEISAAITTLLHDSDRDRLTKLAYEQRLGAALRRVDTHIEAAQ